MSVTPAPSPFANLPSVDRLLGTPAGCALSARYGRLLVLDAIRDAVADTRADIAQALAAKTTASPDCSSDAILARAAARLRGVQARGPRRILNLTGTVIHTNLGRAPLPEAARDALMLAAGACDVEFDLRHGRRGERDEHAEALLCALTGAEAATVVNNCAAAVLLVLNTFALGREVPVSRGELVEIGGAFRMPDVMQRAGAILREVGTTNRTHPQDFEAAIGADTGLVMKVHPSNYVVEGFSTEVDIATLSGLCRTRGIPLAWDLGSGCITDFSRLGLTPEPTVQDGLRAGADLVLFSGDKLLGGPQCGIIVGRREYIAALRRNPLKRALRVDKLALAALAAVLRLWSDGESAATTIPVLRSLTRPVAAIEAVAAAAAAGIRPHLHGCFEVELRATSSQIGSGALPVEQLPSVSLALTPSSGGERQLEALQISLRATPIPVVGRIADGQLLFDCRCLEDPGTLIDQFQSIEDQFRSNEAS